MTTRIPVLLRQDTAANWTSVNPILRSGEEGRETDTGKRKVGDGTTRWNALAYDVGGSVADRLGLTTTAVKTSAYTAAPGDYVICNATSAFPVTFPTAPADGTVIGVQLRGQSGSNAVTVTLGGSDRFDNTSGPTTKVLSALTQSLIAEYNAAAAIWYVVIATGPTTTGVADPGSNGIVIRTGAGTAAARALAAGSSKVAVTNADGTAGNPTVDVQPANIPLDTLGAPAGDVSLNGHKATNVADPTAAQDAATRAYVLAQITALVNSSPSTLDTLKELADALGDDPNFATTITTLIGTKLAKASNLSDVASAVTALANIGGAPTLPDSGAEITAAGPTTATVNKTYRINTTSNAVALALPSAPAVGSQVLFKVTAPNPLVNAFTWSTSGADVINRAGGTTSGTLVLVGAWALFTYIGSNIWVKLEGEPLAQLDGRYQPLDTDLTDFAALSPANDDVLQRKAGHWTNRTPAQLLTDLNLGQTALLNKILAGFTLPTNALDKWKEGHGRTGTFVTGAVNTSATTLPIADLAIAPVTGFHRRYHIEDEEVFSTAGESVVTAITGVTSVATTGIFTKTAHGLVVGEIVSPDANLLDSFLTIGGRYYVSATNFAANTFSLATSPSGTVLTGTTNDTNLTLNRMILTITRGVNGSTAASHAIGAPMYASKVKVVAHIGDSTVEGSDNSHPYQQNDSWSVRAGRTLAERMGGLVAECWPYWRNTGTPASANEDYVASNPGGGTILADTNASHDVGWPGAVIASGVATPNPTVFTWTRPPYKRVACIDFYFVDYGANAVLNSYSTDGGATWVDFTDTIGASIFVSGKGLLRRIRVAVNDPTDFRFRSCSKAGVAHTLVFPWVPIVTWSVYPAVASTEGVLWANLGWPGRLLAGMLNARVVHDAVTDGAGGLTSATAAFVANDVNSYCFLDGVQTTIATRTNGTTATTAASIAAGSGKRLTILQGSGTGDWMAQFFGHHGSWFPDLVILGTLVNDMANNEPDMYGDCLQWLITQLQPYADLLLVAPYEFSGTATPTVQASYRTVMHTIAAANNVAILDLYDAFAAYGYTGYSALNSGGYMADSVHLNYKGNNWIAAHLARVLGMI